MLNRKLSFCCLAIALTLLTSQDGVAGRFQPTPEPAIWPLHECPTAEQVRQAIKPINEIRAKLKFDVGSVEEEGLPPDCSYHVFQERKRARALYPEMIDFHWRPTNFFHQPLYFDDQPLERYGQSVFAPIQPVISGGRFFMTLPIIPYRIGLDYPHDAISTLAYYRPGGCVPSVREKVMPAFELDAGLLQAGTALALVFVLP